MSAPSTPTHHPRKSLELRFVPAGDSPSAAPSPSHRRISIARPLTPSGANQPAPSPAHSRRQSEQPTFFSLSAPVNPIGPVAVASVSNQYAVASPQSSSRPQTPSSKFDPKPLAFIESAKSDPSTPMQIYPVSQVNPDGTQVLFDNKGNSHLVHPPISAPPVDENNKEDNVALNKWTDPPASSSLSSLFQMIGFVMMFVAFHLFLFSAGTFYWIDNPDGSHFGLFYACPLSLRLPTDTYCVTIAQSTCAYTVDGGPAQQLSNCSVFDQARGAEALAAFCSLIGWIIMGICLGVKSRVPRFIATFFGFIAAGLGVFCMVQFINFAGSSPRGVSFQLGIAAWVVALVGDVIYGVSLCT